jgi:outer membrane protein TolC
MKKIFVTSLITAMLISSFAYADTTAMTLDRNLTLDEVYALTISNDIAVKQADDTIEIAEDALNDALREKEDLEWSYSTADAYMELVYTDDFYPITAANDLENAKEDKEELLEDIKIEVTNTYISYKQLQDTLTEKKAGLLKAQTTYDNKTKEYELGLITESDLESYEISLLQANLSVSKAENDLEQAAISFNQMIGYPIDTTFNLSTVIDVATDLNYNIIVLTNTIETNNKVLLDINQEIEEAKLKIELIEENVLDRKSVTVNGVTSYQYGEKQGYTLAKNALDDLEEDYAEALKDEVIGLRVAYNNLRSEDLAVKINKLNYESATRAFSTAIVKHDLGLITAFDLQSAKDGRDSAYEAYISSYNNLYISNLKFSQLIGTYQLGDDEIK